MEEHVREPRRPNDGVSQNRVPRRKYKLNREQVLFWNRKYWMQKRILDVILSAIALVVLSPLMLLIALLVVIDSPGAGPIFSQMRVGKDGELFKLYKFRSMRPDAEKQLDRLLVDNEMDGPVFKIKNDPRITRLGRILRRTSLDELPQLINILRGEMSIVGPRPALPREAEQYDDYQRQRLMITPGLTCYWQTQPHRNDLSFEEWLELDLKYIDERNFLIDWKIIFRTFRVILEMSGQ